MNISKLLIRFDIRSFNFTILKLILKYFFEFTFGRNEYVVNEFGLRFVIRPRTTDLYVIGEVFGDYTYDIPELKSKDTIQNILDIGSHIGTFSLWTSLNFKPHRIINIEMDTQNYKQLEKNIKLNGLNAICHLINKAIYYKNTEIYYNKISGASGMNFISEKPTPNKIETITLKDVINNNHLDVVDLLKVDIEGSEKYVFTKENESIFSKKIRNIVMEYHNFKDNYSESHYIEYLERLGFIVKTKGTLQSVTSVITGVKHK